jgi:hypothetical protein
MGTLEKSMEEIFELSPLAESNKAIKEAKSNLPVPSVSDADLTTDLKDAYEQTKDNLQELIDQGKEAMEEILHIAKEGQHPRAFEVYGTLLKNVVDANKELLNVQKQMREMENAGKKSTTNTTIDKAVFVGTPQDLNKLLRGEDIGS